ncbi:MAG TPA: hypothetical protein VK907_14365, partial [Phnomibacter sp.]|nr:hypothetical protein [Phnomibacter sp.]
GGIYDRRPCEVEGFVQDGTSGFYFDTAGEIVIRNSSVTWGANRPEYFKHAIRSANTVKTTVLNFSGRSAFPEKWPDIFQ